MEPMKQIDNSVFLSTLTGVVLMIATIATILLGINTGSAEKPYIAASIATGLSATGLLLNALRKDRQRLA
jgi:hypothetical protein